MKIQTTTRGRTAFTLAELLVIIAVVGVLAVILIPAFLSPEIKAPRINCVNNLKQLGLALKLWANDNTNSPTRVSVTNGGAMEFAEKGIAFPIFQVMSNELGSPKILHCPVDVRTTYAANFTTDFNDSKISYFVGLNPSEDNPNSFLFGDDNLIVDGKPVAPGILNLETNTVVGWTDERHHRAGNVALADGSVQQMTSSGLNELIADAVTNRLVIP